MEVEHKHFSFIVDGDLQKYVQALEAEGWQAIPGVPPVMVYYLARAKKRAEPEQPQVPQIPHALGKMLINDDLVGVFGPDGKKKQ